jgi:hypothetical protein
MNNSLPLDTSTIEIHGLLERQKSVAVIWNVEDVQSVREDLSEDQAWAVLKRCRRVHSCELGFNWLLIETVADFLFPEPDKPVRP